MVEALQLLNLPNMHMSYGYKNHYFIMHRQTYNSLKVHYV